MPLLTHPCYNLVSNPYALCEICPFFVTVFFYVPVKRACTRTKTGKQGIMHCSIDLGSDDGTIVHWPGILRVHRLRKWIGGGPVLVGGEREFQLQDQQHLPVNPALKEAARRVSDATITTNSSSSWRSRGGGEGGLSTFFIKLEGGEGGKRESRQRKQRHCLASCASIKASCLVSIFFKKRSNHS